MAFWSEADNIFLEGENQEALKRAFAAAYLKNQKDPYIAAKKVFPGQQNLNRITTVAFYWPNDKDVLQYMEEIVAEFGSAAYLPSKEEVIRKILDLAEQQHTPVKEKLAAFKLAAEMSGHITNKVQVSAPNNDPLTNLLQEIGGSDRPKPAA